MPAANVCGGISYCTLRITQPHQSGCCLTVRHNISLLSQHERASSNCGAGYALQASCYRRAPRPGSTGLKPSGRHALSISCQQSNVPSRRLSSARFLPERTGRSAGSPTTACKAASDCVWRGLPACIPYHRRRKTSPFRGRIEGACPFLRATWVVLPWLLSYNMRYA
jgi:hypothetical protein